MKANKNKIKIKKGDIVKIISGKFKDQTGKVNSIKKKTNSLTIENINFKTKHIKPKQTEEKGTIKKIEGPIHCSNIIRTSKEKKF
uniref:Large ribosomal subunit protein uL24c n=1 Tax=Bostrychia simpliciuscula TaxID=324754 RepID=A0A1Z1M8G1_9FLOR|nr:ribosomal protein L24 [Bostrychia simpliciuscula]ARW62131.1 ribosomal protein L24 [Bostrychia simpliciuscula]